MAALWAAMELTVKDTVGNHQGFGTVGSTGIRTKEDLERSEERTVAVRHRDLEGRSAIWGRRWGREGASGSR